MAPELFHLWETASNDPSAVIEIAGIIATISVVAVLGYLLYRRRISPLLLWLVLFLLIFGFSQIFPQNRSAYRMLAIIDFIGSGVLTWVVMREVRKYRQKQERQSNPGSTRSDSNIL